MAITKEKRKIVVPLPQLPSWERGLGVGSAPSASPAPSALLTTASLP
ncbi:MAG: hypothetical protein F6K31_10520 [Symploca sp. SIO2G7]|nr:hypothetical protein [Symploca sp. SIO2G7]